MKKQPVYLLLLGFLVVFAACKKEDETEKMEKQFIGTWQQVSVEEKVNGGSWEDYTDACDLQEMVKIVEDKDHSLSLYSNDPSQCGSQTYIGRWDIFEDGKEMIWNLDGVAEPIKKEVIKVDETTLITTHDPGLTTPTQIKITYKKR